MVEQGVSIGGWNWRHGGTYLSVSSKKAVGYPAKRRWGSELLTRALEVDALLEAAGLSSGIEKYPSLAGTRRKHAKLILIEAHSVCLNGVRAESGESANNAIERLQRLECSLDSNIGEVLAQTANFELTEPVKSEKIVVYHYHVDLPVVGKAGRPEIVHRGSQVPAAD